MPELEPFAFAAIITGLFLGGVLKGATGAGLPIIALPVIASVTDIRFAVVLLAAPNFFSNAWQIAQYRKFAPDLSLYRNYALSGTIGAAIGTVFLAYLPLSVLSIIAVFIVWLYLLLRITKPDYRLPLETAQKWVIPVGLFGGSLQGAIGLSSPVSITFMHAIRLGREPFIFTMSVFFAVLSILQVPTQILLGLSSLKFAAISNLSLFPIIIGLYAGNQLGKKMNPRTFDLTIMGLLTAVSIKMIVDIFSA